MEPAGYGAYRRIQTETSSPGELVVMLFSALANDLQRAEQGLGDGDGEQAHLSLVRAQDIVMEPLASLDLDSGELAAQLSALYHYLHERLVHANVQKDVDAVREVAALVTPIRDAWTQIVGAAQREAGVNAGRAAE